MSGNLIQGHWTVCRGLISGTGLCAEMFEVCRCIKVEDIWLLSICDVTFVRRLSVFVILSVSNFT